MPYIIFIPCRIDYYGESEIGNTCGVGFKELFPSPLTPGWNALLRTGHFTVACITVCPLIASETRIDLALIQTSLLFSFKCKLLTIRKT